MDCGTYCPDRCGPYLSLPSGSQEMSSWKPLEATQSLERKARQLWDDFPGLYEDISWEVPDKKKRKDLIYLDK